MSRTITKRKASKKNSLRKEYSRTLGKIYTHCKYGRECCGDAFGSVGTSHSKLHGRRYKRHVQDMKLAQEIMKDLMEVTEE